MHEDDLKEALCCLNVVSLYACKECSKVQRKCKEYIDAKAKQKSGFQYKTTKNSLLSFQMDTGSVVASYAVASVSVPIWYTKCRYEGGHRDVSTM